MKKTIKLEVDPVGYDIMNEYYQALFYEDWEVAEKLKLHMQDLFMEIFGGPDYEDVLYNLLEKGYNEYEDIPRVGVSKYG